MKGALFTKNISVHSWCSNLGTSNSLTGIAPLFGDIADFGQGYREQKKNSAGLYFWYGLQGAYIPIHHDLNNNMLVQNWVVKKLHSYLYFKCQKFTMIKVFSESQALPILISQGIH